jgi:MoxR-like ATPase
VAETLGDTVGAEGTDPPGDTPAVGGSSPGAGFTGPDEAAQRLSSVGYLADQATATVAYLADRLGKPVLVEGPAGVGKTELAKSVARAERRRLVRLQCYEGLDEAKALYEWNYAKQLLRIQYEHARPGGGEAWTDIFSTEYLLARPLLTALTADEPVVLLIDEVDKVDFEFEALLLELLADFQVTIPELGTMAATSSPSVVLTSNNTRELSEALKRRCLYLHMDHPEVEREKAIVAARAPDIPAALADQLVRVVHSLRGLGLRKPPAISETLDWARALVELGHDIVDEEALVATVPVVCKDRGDVTAAVAHLTGADTAARPSAATGTR